MEELAITLPLVLWRNRVLSSAVGISGAKRCLLLPPPLETVAAVPFCLTGQQLKLTQKEKEDIVKKFLTI